MRRILLAAIALMLSWSVHAGAYKNPEQCSFAVAAVDKPGSGISARKVKSFLESLMSKTCQSSVEYSEWSNEALFNLMRRDPEIFFSVLRESTKAVQMQVNGELEHPIHDMIDYPAINKSISAIAGADLRKFALDVFTPLYKRHLSEVEVWEKNNHMKWPYPKDE